MGLFAEIFSGFERKNKENIAGFDKRANYIFYKIVDVLEGKYVLQCINTSAIFYAKIVDIVFDTDLLWGLHPIQACYVGIEYANHLKENSLRTSPSYKRTLNKNSTYRYGNYYLHSQTRNGHLCFVDNRTNENFIMDPRDIALSKNLITEFDAAQASYIGLAAGIKINNPARKLEIDQKLRKPHLRVIK